MTYIEDNNRSSDDNHSRYTQMRDLLLRYNVFLFDIWGVIHNSVDPYPGVVPCLNHLISLNKTVLFLSNAPRPAAVIVEKLIEMGIKTSSKMVFTSGDITRDKLSHFTDPFYNHPSKRVFHLGAHRNQDLLANLPILLAESIETADVLLLSAFMDEGENLAQHDTLLKKAADLKIPAICANPDKALLNDNKTRYCAGVLAEKFQQLGGDLHYYGKPHLPIYEEIFKRLHIQGSFEKKEILMIGDTLETDILGANTAGIDSALVLTGNTQLLLERFNIPNNPELSYSLDEHAETHAEAKVNVLKPIFNSQSIYPTWIIPGIGLEN